MMPKWSWLSFWNEFIPFPCKSFRNEFILVFNPNEILVFYEISFWFHVHSLHDRRFMSQAGRTRYFARSAIRARSARRGEEKNKAPVRSPLFLLFRPLTPTNINYPRWCQKNQWKHDPLSRENCHLSSAKRPHCSRNEELRLFPWLRELLPKFTGLNHLILYVGQC